MLKKFYFYVLMFLCTRFKLNKNVLTKKKIAKLNKPKFYAFFLIVLK